jgi:hypothetical protein
MDFIPCPLDPQKTGELNTEGYTIEKIMFQTFPGSYVPANLYRPGVITEKLPAVLVPIGHWPLGKALPQIQIFCANLCMNGFIVLTFDPQYQGERSDLNDDFSDIERDDYICVANHMKAALRDEIFPIEGAMRLKDELKELYGLYGVPERLEMAVSNSMHDIHPETRAGCYYWMNKWLRKKEGALPEREVRIFSPEELMAGYAEKNRFDVIDWNRQAFSLIQKQRGPCPEAGLKSALLGFFSNIQRERFRYYPIEKNNRNGAVYTQFRIVTEKSYDLDGTYIRKDPDDTRLVIILDLEKEGIEAGQWLDRGNVLVLKPFGMYYTTRENHKIRFDTQALVVQTILAGGTDMISLRVNEILCAIEHSRLETGTISEIIFETTGQGGVLALIAGLFEDSISEIRASHMLRSYAEIVNHRNVFINDADIIEGFLKQFDIVDLIKANQGRRLIFRDPVDAFGNIADHATDRRV